MKVSANQNVPYNVQFDRETATDDLRNYAGAANILVLDIFVSFPFE